MLHFIVRNISVRYVQIGRVKLRLKLALSATVVALAIAACAPLSPNQDIAPEAYTNAAIKGAVPITGTAAQDVRLSSAKVLFWSSAERSANFRAMDRLFPVTVVKPSAKPRALPLGTPLHGLDEAAVRAEMAAQHSVGILVLQNGQIRAEFYADGLKPTDRWTSFSMAKSLTSTLAGAAVQDGYIASVTDPVTKYVPELKGSGYDGVTVEHVLTMTSGVKWNEDYTDPKSDVVAMFSQPVPDGADPDAYYLAKLPREAAPGTKWVYKTGETNLIGLIVQRATGKLLSDYASEKLAGTAGLEHSILWQTNMAGLNVGGCCLAMTLRDYGRVGLFLAEGAPGVVPNGWMARASSPISGVGIPGFGYGYQFWTYPQGRWGLRGIFGQSVTIVPDKNAVVVFLSNWDKASDRELNLKQRAFAERLVAGL